MVTMATPGHEKKKMADPPPPVPPSLPMHITGTGDSARTKHTKHHTGERMVNLKGQRSAEGDNLHRL